MIKGLLRCARNDRIAFFDVIARPATQAVAISNTESVSLSNNLRLSQLSTKKGSVFIAAFFHG
jgi:hypothetical protein